MNRLKAYCRRVILTAAREYAGGKRRTRESTEAAFLDAMQGTDTGWWTDLIYTVDMLKMAHRYRCDIAEVIGHHLDEFGAGNDAWLPDWDGGWRNVLPALLDRYTFADYCGDNGERRAALAAAKVAGLRFAVEYLTHELASEYGV